MGSYLEAYGSQEHLRAKRTRLVKIVSIAVVLALVIGGILYATFRNFKQESQAKTFVQLLRDRQFQDAYRMWGCTEAHPCPNYPYTAFRDDWEPSTTHPDAASPSVGDVEACGSGVVIQITYPQSKPAAIWVERSNNVISFSPWPQCPGKRWHFKEFWKSVFGG